MPEIWINYGSTDIALDIKFGNLLAQVSPDLPLLSDEEVAATLNNIPMSNNMLILALSRSRSVQRIIEMLQHVIHTRGFEGVNVNTLQKKPYEESNEGFNVGSHDCPLFLARPYENVIFVSRTTYDPLFGFSGTPTILLRNYMQERMLAAFESRQSDLPSPGIAIEMLTSNTIVEVDYAKSAIVGGSNEPDFSNLTASLNLLWNSMHAIKENGSIILLAENRDGLGEGALQMFVEGKMKIEDLGKKGFYVPGLEHLLYIQNLRQRYDLGILSTLPQYYLKKLGFECFGGAKDVLQKLLAKHGKNHKILVSSEGDLALLKLREQTRTLPEC